MHIDSRSLTAAGHEVLVCTDSESMRPRALPDELRACLESYTFSELEARDQLGVKVRAGR